VITGQPQLIDLVDSDAAKRQDAAQTLRLDGRKEPCAPLVGQFDSRVVTQAGFLSAGEEWSSRNPSLFANRVLVGVTTLAAIVFHAIPWLYEGYPWCGWLGIALALALARSGGVVACFWGMWLWCSCSIAIAFHWSPAAMAYTLSSGYALGLLVATPLILWDGLRLALGYWLATKLTRDIRFFWLASATTTIALEYVMPGVFPWKLGLTQLSIPWFIQGVDVFGSSYATLVAFAAAGVLHIAGAGLVSRHFVVAKHAGADLGSQFPHGLLKSFQPVVMLLVANMLYSAVTWTYWKMLSDAAPKINVGMVQVDPSNVESTENARIQTERIAEHVDLMCWPESSGGNYELRLGCLANEEQVFEMSRAPERGLRPWPNPRCELLLGAKNYVGNCEDPEELYVTALLVDEQENIAARYNKRFLMPFGEYVPGEDYIPGMAQLFDMAEHVRPGSQALPLQSRTGANVGVMLCYEDMVPQAAREMVVHGANLLISLANGSAFESHYTLYQHRMIAHLRALELRRYLLRCAATGETCVINPLGEVERRLPMQVSDALATQTSLLEQRTLYSRFPWLLPGIGLISLVAWKFRNVRSFSEKSI
jgi:apolipoprotein N-acyltransferase